VPAIPDLRDSVAVVTGAASGIGFALADAFLGEGGRVVLADIEAPALALAEQRLAAQHADRVHALVTDVADLAAVERLAATTLERFGRVDVLCNNAGVSTFTTIDRLTISDWEWVLGVDLWGVVHGVHAFLPIMLEQGTPSRIVNTASVAGLMSGIAYLGPYAVAKVGVVSLSETLRAEMADAGAPVGVSVLCPGFTETNVLDGHRNRPTHLGVEARTDGGEAWRTMAREGMRGPTGKQPAELAAMVVDAVRADRFWVLSHDDVLPIIEQRFAEILAAVPYRTS
jgi:NAD(P)-dependent dehydrogenase (short-subunit alcohol dehydrogenase family)